MSMNADNRCDALTVSVYRIQYEVDNIDADLPSEHVWI
jgi:hypothetical protein